MNTKKADLSARKIIVACLIIFVVLMMVPQMLNLSEVTKDGISSFEEQACNSNPNYQLIYSNDLTKEDQEEEWKEQLGDKTNCAALGSTEDECSCVQQKIWEKLNEEENRLNEYDNTQLTGTGTQYFDTNFNLEGINDIDIRDFNYDIDANIEKLPSEVKLTYDRLNEIEIGGIFGIGGESAYQFMLDESLQKGLNPLLPLVVITQESKGDPSAVSYTGCAGLMQFCYSTAKDYPEIFDVDELIPSCHEKNRCSEDDRMNPEKSIRAGISKLNKDANSFNNNLLLVLTAYNAGPGISSKCNNVENLENEEQLFKCILGATYSYYKTESKTTEVNTYLTRISTNYKEVYS